MALLFTRMATCLFCFAASLLTRLSDIFTLPRSMAQFPAKVGTTFQFSSADLPTTDFRKPARLVFQCLLSTQARFLREKRTFGAGFVVAMAAVWYFRMTARPRSFTVESTWRWGSSTRQRRLKYSLAAVTADFIKDSFPTTPTWPLVTKLWAVVVPAFEHPSTRASANMLGFEPLVHHA